MSAFKPFILSVLSRLTSRHLLQPKLIPFSTVPSAKIKLSEFKYFDIEDRLPVEVDCTREDALKYLETMLVMRRMETSAANMYKSKEIRGFCHLYSGEEAVAIGCEAALKPGDLIIASYRCHGLTLTRGSSVLGVLAELAGRSTGVCAGKSGSIHMFWDNFFGGNGIVGAQVPLGVGLALKLRHTGEQNISVVFYGDGASNQGQVFEAFNIAKLWNLPVVFFCENNKYGMGTSAYRSSASVEYYKRAGYIPGIWADGMDLLTIRQVTDYARQWCLAGRGPILIEAETYRYHGHSMSDPGTSYRTREEVQTVRKQRDPIMHFQTKIVQAGLVDEEEIKEMERKVRQDVDAAQTQALKEPIPVPDDAYNHVLIKPPPNFKIRGCDIMTQITPKVN